MATPTEAIPSRVLRPAFGRLLYCMRSLGASACIIVAWIYLSNFGKIRIWHFFALALTLSYPHILHILSRRVKAHQRFALAASLVDAVVIGAAVYAVGFSLIPTLAFLSVALANGVALGGVSFAGFSVLFVMAGIGAPAVFYGFDADPHDLFLMDAVSVFFLVLYFPLFAWAANRSSIWSKQSRKELIQQKLTLEIEKNKSDSLLWSLLPASMAAVFKKRGVLVEPCRYDDVTLLAADVHEFDRLAESVDPAPVIDELNHFFKAFDKIVQRHGLEPLKTFGDAYLALGGGPAPDGDHPDNAMHAAVEIQRFAAERRQSRQASGLPGFELRVVVHSGPAVCGIVKARKFSFDVWGDAIREALRIKQECPPGGIAASDSALAKIKAPIPKNCLRIAAAKTDVHASAFLSKAEMNVEFEN